MSNALNQCISLTTYFTGRSIRNCGDRTWKFRMSECCSTCRQGSTSLAVRPNNSCSTSSDGSVWASLVRRSGIVSFLDSISASSSKRSRADVKLLDSLQLPKFAYFPNSSFDYKIIRAIAENRNHANLHSLRADITTDRARQAHVAFGLCRKILLVPRKILH